MEHEEVRRKRRKGGRRGVRVAFVAVEDAYADWAYRLYERVRDEADAPEDDGAPAAGALEGAVAFSGVLSTAASAELASNAGSDVS